MYENEKMSFLKKFINSTYNFKSYNYFISEKLSKAVLYLLLLAFVSSGFMVLKEGFSFNKEFSKMKTILNEEMPSFTLDNDELIIDSEMPIIYEEDNTIFVIDTSNELDIKSLDKYNSGIFIGKNELIFKENSTKFTTIKYSSLELKNSLTSEYVNRIVNTFGNIFIIIGLVLIFIFLLIGKLISVFAIMPLAALIIASILNKKLSYSNLIKISAYALTVPILLKTFLKLVGITIPVFFILYYGIGIVYLIFALKNIHLDVNESLEPIN
ncbi:DUF1189 domain-containing protein [Clostridium gasigenes]|uniref:DUF1189 domain-containing protein n=1 Tax=Clostridium gasigenes TaxID=94869 RepID=UPI0014384775|nr:DUF1189 domain-containing protein [Clostridium gasigenes]MBU3131652.1 DUF1189 domain-containing protein [Clostridium gasigenes]MBU3135127.1 DUF1189 domain-containing protein [Clostridium gasigenes]NKF05413.1 DUF1189 domain-containing protein [Clostridium gasigenes]QSW18859.1 DUF1189 domain-containing protein [Clostridium gasigenes]